MGGVLEDLNLLIVGITLFVIGILGLLVFVRDRKSATSKAFLGFTVATIVWGVSNYLNYQFTSPAELILWVLRAHIFISVWHAFSFFHLAYVFPEERVKFPRWFKYIIFAVILSSLVNLTPLSFTNITELPPPGQAAETTKGPGMLLFAVLSLLFISSGIYFLFRKTLKTKFVVEKKQFSLILTGTTITFLLVLTFNLLLPNVFSYFKLITLGVAAFLPFVVFTAYAIVKHHLFNIKVIATELFTAAIVITLFVEIFTAPTLLERIFRVGVFAIISVFGYFLIKGVWTEVLAREQMQYLAEQLQRTNAALKQLDAAKSEFISIASHQLRTPLTAIKGFISMVLEGSYGQIPFKHTPVLKKVYESNERLVKVVNDLLNISRIEAGRFKYEWKDTQLVELVKPLIEKYQKDAKARGLQLEVSLPQQVPLVVADPDKLSLVVGNLLDNAIHYTSKGMVQLRLSVAGKMAHIAIRDTGIGMEENEIHLLFRKFIRGKRVPKIYTEGSGLGLYVAKRIIEDHRGRIWAESAGRGRGSTFFIDLPVKPPKEESQFREFIEGI